MKPGMARYKDSDFVRTVGQAFRSLDDESLARFLAGIENASGEKCGYDGWLEWLRLPLEAIQGGKRHGKA